MFLSRSGLELNAIWTDQRARLSEALSQGELDAAINRYHADPDVRRAWPEHSKRIAPVEVSPSDVFRSAVELELGGRRPSTSEADRRSKQMMAKRIDEPHVRVRVPIHHLDTQHDPSRKFGHPDSWSTPGEDRVAREVDYSKRHTPFPPIYATHNERSARIIRKRGHRPTLYVANGNHRVAAAILRGDTHIDAHVPQADWDRFKALADEWGAAKS